MSAQEFTTQANRVSAWRRVLLLLSDGVARTADEISATMPDVKHSTVSTLLSLEAGIGRKIAAKRADTHSNRKVYFIVDKAAP